MLKDIRFSLVSLLRNIYSSIAAKQTEQIKNTLGYILVNNQKAKNLENNYLWDKEFKVYSQFGEDGILTYLCQNLEIHQPNIMEIGTGNFLECNSRFLCEIFNAKLVAVDGKSELVKTLNGLDINWKTTIHPLVKWVNSGNIVEIIDFAKDKLGNIDILSIDLDGIDYWVAEKIDVKDMKIIIAEYNPLFGYNFPVTIFDDPAFVRSKKHFSELFYGASLPAFIDLFEKQGFKFIGTNHVGHNAFFCNEKELDKIKIRIPNLMEIQNMVGWNVRDGKNRKGKLEYISGNERLEMIGDLEVLNLQTRKSMLVKNLYN